MAATSRPDLVDVALLRPGRIDKAVFCNFPHLQDRQQILDIYLTKFRFSESLTPFERQEFLTEMAGETEHFTSADLKGLVQNAQLAKMSRALQALSAQEDAEADAEVGIDRADIKAALASFSRGMDLTEVKRFDRIYADF